MSAELQTLRNIGEAIRAMLRVTPLREREVVSALATVPGVKASQVREVISSFVNSGWIVRRDGRLFSGTE